jgi:hypothetical protein
VSINIDNNENEKFTSSEVFEFLNNIREYFGKLKDGRPSVDIGITGPIKRITFGGDFGCNLLSDVEVCKKFKAKQMKVYTMKDNKDNIAMTVEEEQTSQKKTNHVFVVDVDLEKQLTTQFGGGSEEDEDEKQVNQNKKRICIGAPIENGKWVSSNKRKTRRKLPLLMSSS